MLTIRLQRTGRKGYASFRVVVQDSRFSPSSGRVVAQLGHYNPHTKEVKIDKENAEKYLKTGAQPTPRVIRLLEAEKVTLPEWVKKATNDKKRNIRNPEKLRKNQPKEEVSAAEEPAVEAEKVEDAEIAEEATETVSAEAIPETEEAQKA